MGATVLEEIILKIDGMNVSCPPGSSILEAARSAGITIPSLCFHPDLKPFGACRLCLVEEISSGRLFASCVTPAAPGMVIVTNSERIQKHRRNIVRLMMAEHPESCLVCSKGNRCELREIAAALGIGESRLYPMPNVKSFEQVNPFIVRDLTKCILCSKCIRVDHELVVVGAVDYNLRGFKSRPATLHDLPLEHSSCTFCGSCVSACPTGALSPNTVTFVGTPERESISICGFCGVGCSLLMGSAGDSIVEVNPSGKSDTVNGSTLCVKGHFAYDFLQSQERLNYPLLRTDNGWERISWSAALELAGSKLLEIKKEYGPTSLAFLGSSKCTNEENYLFQKMARLFFGTNNVDSGGYLSGRFALQGLSDRLGRVSLRKPLSSISKASAILVLGADPTQSAPVAGYYIKRAAKSGLPLVEINPRKTGLSSLATFHLGVVPSTDLAALAAIAKCLAEQGWIDHAFIDQCTTGFQDFYSKLKTLEFNHLCAIARIDPEAIKGTCELLAGKRIAFVVGSGILRQKHGPHVLDAIVDLALMSGSLGDRGGVYILARECNEMGSWDMGSAPDFLPGPYPLSDEEKRKQIERLWKTKISPDPGLNMIRIVEEAEKGHLKALYIMGENPLRSLPGEDRIKRAFKKLEFLIVQDIFQNEITEMADLVMPGAAVTEKAGSFTNLEGRIQCFEPVVKPPGEAMPDWEVLDSLMLLLGQLQRYGSLARIRKEIARVVPEYFALATDGVGGWVKGETALFSGEHGGEEIRIPFSRRIEIGQQAKDSSLSMRVIFGSTRFHMGSGTRTGRSRRITRFCPDGFAEISAHDADSLGLQEGDKIRIKNQNGSVVKKIKVNRDQPEGMVFLPWGFDNNDARVLIHLSQFGGPDFEGWNSCRANVQKV
ncbi:MAG: hypothetical protein DRG76_07230 [Deltaproteobacteria bacterium]|nr:MAG: hypothetical protein DRG76_07230 [Deltaproteobacteria bacterium]